MFSLSKLIVSLLSENIDISYFSPNFFFKMIFLQDEKIFFDQIFLKPQVPYQSYSKNRKTKELSLKRKNGTG